MLSVRLAWPSILLSLFSARFVAYCYYLIIHAPSECSLLALPRSVVSLFIIYTVVNIVDCYHMKTLLSSILISSAVIVGSLLLDTKSAEAYCVYNRSESDTIAALQLPVTTSSFKAVIPPGDQKCCHYSEKSCTSNNDGQRYGKTVFLLLKGELEEELEKNQHLITVRAIPEDINRVASKIIEFIRRNEDSNDSTIDPALKQELYEQGLKYVRPDANLEKLGVIVTYNGGIVWYDGQKEPVGCWSGPCQGQDVNSDGTRGPQP